MRHFAKLLQVLSFLASVTALAAMLQPAKAADLKVAKLRCEYLSDPLGIDQLQPRLTWLLQSGQRGQRQTAYQIVVASSAEKLAREDGDLWDSGKVAGGETVNVVYGGKPLASRQTCYWKVRVWDRDDHPSKWSEMAHWSMGLLDNADWSATYISYRDESPIFTDREQLFLPAARQYRKEFGCNKAIKRATLYATALGIYEVHCNGQRVGDGWFAPGWTDYHQRAYYNTYDVTQQMRQGKNAIGVWLADGWYSGYVGFGLLTGIGTEKVGRYTYGKTPAVMAQLEIEYEDGTKQIVGTDESWRVTGEGPVQEADLLMGEYYDARQEMLGWATAGFDDSNWEKAVLAAAHGPIEATFYEFRNPNKPDQNPEVEGRTVDLGFKRPKLEAFPGNPVRVTQEVSAVQITKREPGTYIFDLGQNFAGVVQLKLQGPQGHKVRLRYGEMLHPDGSLMTENLRRARAQDYYVCKGDPEGETYRPRFTFHGFQYVEVSNFPGEPNNETLTGIVLHSDTPRTSSFECSDPMVNRLFQNVVWTQRANFIDLPTDCPQRDERMGWTGDAQIYVSTATYNADVAAFYTKWLRELMESQRPSGTFPGYAPYPFQHGWDFGTAWCDAGIVCPWTIWHAYGDTRVIETCWENMTRFMEWRNATSQNGLGINHGNNWGDWLAQGETTPIDYIDTIYFALSTRMMADMAAAVGYDQEAQAYRAQFAKIQQAFQQKYMQDDGTLAVNTQTAYALALATGLIAGEDRKLAGDILAERIEGNGCRMATGFLGTRSLLPALSDTGHHNLAAFLFQSHEFPSWGYEIDQGATSIWERWDSYTKQDGFGRHNASMNSFAHYSFGAVCEWMFKYLAGIRAAEPGFRSIEIRPVPPSLGSNADHESIDWVKASYDSIRGRIMSSWRLDGEHFELGVDIPVNTVATVFLPTDDPNSLTIDGSSVSAGESVEFIRTEPDRAVLRLQSGHYDLKSHYHQQESTGPFTATSRGG